MGWLALPRETAGRQISPSAPRRGPYGRGIGVKGVSVRIRTVCFAACALPLAASISCGSDDSPPASACQAVAACTATPTLVASPTPACGDYPRQLGACPTTKPACQKPVVPGAGVQQSGLSPAGTPLGTFTVGQVVSFDVPAGTSSITIIEQANGQTPDTVPPDTVTLNGNIVIDNTAVPDKITNPGGTVVYNDNPPSPPPAD